MRGLRIAATLCVTTAALAACACPHQGSAASSADAVHMTTCSCVEGKAGGTAWCDKCGVGFVHGEKVACKGCYTQKTGGEPCPACTKR